MNSGLTSHQQRVYTENLIYEENAEEAKWYLIAGGQVSWRFCYSVVTVSYIWGPQGPRVADAKRSMIVKWYLQQGDSVIHLETSRPKYGDARHSLLAT